jgi:hypothetical protein
MLVDAVVMTNACQRPQIWTFQFRSSASRTAALDEALCDSNGADRCCTWVHVHRRAPHAPRHLYAGLDTRTMRPLLNPVPLKQRLPAAFTT